MFIFGEMDDGGVRIKSQSYCTSVIMDTQRMVVQLSPLS